MMKFTVVIEGYKVCNQTIEVEAEDHMSAIDLAWDKIDENAWTVNEEVIDLEVMDISPDEPELEDEDELEDGELEDGELEDGEENPEEEL
jgi:hypothetical protein